jgi:uncharacterized damage-inducible protein DinB
MLIPALQEIFRRDLLKLRQEINSYTDDEKIWYVEKKIANSAGNLCLHLVGNLNTYIGAQLGNSGYIRNREKEFSQKGLSKAELIGLVDKTIEAVDQSLNEMTEEMLKEEYPQIVFSGKMTTGFFLVHLASHLNYHLGQINYHRRLLDSTTLVRKNVYARTFS